MSTKLTNKANQVSLLDILNNSIIPNGCLDRLTPLWEMSFEQLIALEEQEKKPRGSNYPPVSR